VSLIGVPFYLWAHHLSKNDQIWRGNTYREWACFKVRRAPSLLFMRTLFVTELPKGGPCFRRSAMPLHLHKCVARFVSDSWVSCIIRLNWIENRSTGRKSNALRSGISLLNNGQLSSFRLIASNCHRNLNIR